MLQVEIRLLGKDSFISTLIGNVLFNTIGICVFAYSIGVEATCPQISTPKKFFNFFVTCKNLTGGYTFYDRHKFCHRHRWDTLYQKMHMVFFHTYFNKVNFIPKGNAKTNLFQGSRNRVAEYLSPIFRRKYKMVQQQSFIMMFVDVFAHAYNIARQNIFLKPPQGAGY